MNYSEVEAQRQRRLSTSTLATNSSNSTWRCHPYGPDKPGRGAMLFTGPDALRDHRVTVDTEHRYVGENTMSPEGTSEVDYLWRAPKQTPHPRPKSQFVGAIGWGVPDFTDWSAPQTGSQITLGEFRQELEDRHTHLYQNPWYPWRHRNYEEDNEADGFSPHQERPYTSPLYGRTPTATPVYYCAQPITGLSHSTQHVKPHKYTVYSYKRQAHHRKGTPDGRGSQGSSRRGSQGSMHSQHSVYSQQSQHSGY